MCTSSASTGLCGGQWVTSVPTATQPPMRTASRSSGCRADIYLRKKGDLATEAESSHALPTSGLPCVKCLLQNEAHVRTPKRPRKRE